MADRMSNFRKMANVIGLVALGSTAASASVHQNRHEAFGANKTIRSEASEAVKPTEYKFGELWDKYWRIQSDDEIVKGKITDFDKYSTKFPKGFGIDETDPDFDEKYHGTFYGYTAVNKDGIWVYTEDKDAND